MKKFIFISLIILILVAGVGALFFFYEDSSFSLEDIRSNGLAGFLKQGHLGEHNQIYIANNSDPKWNIIKHSGNEANFKLILTNLKDKKTDICFVLKDGVDPSDVDLTNKILYNADGTKIQDDKSKDISIKYETAKCDGQDGYHLSLTEAQAVNINEYIKLGEESTVLVYQPTNQVIFSISDTQDVSATLYWDVYGDKSDWNNTVNDVFVSFDNERYKFGANHSGIVWERYKYVLESEARLENRNGKYYFRTGSGGYKVLTSDICGKINNQTNETANCQFNSYTTQKEVFDSEFNTTFNVTDKYVLEIEFYSDSFIDPEFTFESLESQSILNNVRFEGDNSSHLEITDVGIYNNTVLYMPFDVNVSQTTVYDYTNFDNDGTITNATFDDNGVYGGAFDFNGVDALIQTTLSDSIFNNISLFTYSAWVKTTDNVGIIIGGGRSSVVVELFIDSDGNAKILRGDDKTAGVDISDDNWHHIVGVFNGTDLLFYNDGNLDTTTASNASYIPDGTNVKLGSRVSTGVFFNGLLDEVMILNASLNSSDVLTLFNNQSSRFKSIGTQEIKENNLSLGTDNKINLSITSFQNLQSSNLSARIGSWNVSNGYNLTDPGLVLYFGLNNQSDLGENSTHVLDMTNNGNNGTSFGAIPTVDGRFNGAFQFDGVDDYIDAGQGASLDITGSSLTLSAWVKFDDIDEVERIIDKYMGAGDNGYGMWIAQSGSAGNIRLLVGTDGSGSGLTGVTNLTTGQWYSLVATFDGTNCKVYVNGLLDGSSTCQGTLDSAPIPVQLGKNNQGGGQFNGTMDEVAIYNTSLSADEIKSLYVKGLPNYTYTDSQNITAENTNFTFDIVTEQENVFPELTYFPSLGTQFYSPVLIGNVLIDSFLGEAPPIDAINQVTGCTVINVSGSYILVNDTIVNFPSTCIRINISNVDFDGNGSTIDGATGGAGIRVISGDFSLLTNITLKNIKINDFEDGVVFLQTFDSLIINTSVNSAEDDSFLIDNSDFNNLINITATNASGDATDTGLKFIASNANNITGALIVGNGDGIIMTGTSDDNIITFSNITGSTGQGFESTASTNNNNLIYNNFFNNTDNTNVGNGNDNFFNTSQTATTSVIGGANSGGNYWGNFSGAGYSDTCTVTSVDNLCDNAFNVSEQAECSGVECIGLEMDELPLSFATATVADNEFPIFFNLAEVPSDPLEYVINNIVRLNSSINSTNGTSGVTFDGVNFTAPNISSPLFNITLNDLGANTYTYFWWSYGNGTDENYNQTADQTYTVNKNTTGNIITPFLNGVSANLTLTFPQQVNATFTGSNQTLVTIDRDGVSVVIGLNETASAGEFIYNFSVVTNQNFTLFETNLNLTVLRAIPEGALAGTTPIDYLTAGDVEGTESNTGDADLVYALLREGVVVSNPDTTVLGAGSYDYIYNVSGGQNYTDNSSMDTFTLVVDQIGSQANLTFDLSSPQNFGNAITPTCSNITGVGTPVLTVNNTVISSGSPITLGAGTWNITCTLASTQNFTASLNQSDFIINQIEVSLRLELNGSLSNISITTNETILLNLTKFNADASGVITLINNGTTINSNILEASNLTLFDIAGLYNITGTYASTQNYTINDTIFHVNVTDTIIFPDVEFPIFFNFEENPTDPVEYVVGNIYRFNSSINNTNGTAGIQFDGVNFTATNLSEVFNSTVLDLGVNTYNYFFWAYGNGSDGNFNRSTTLTYTVSINTTGNIITPLLNGLNQNLNVEFPQQVNASFTGANQTDVAIERNGTSITIYANETVGAGFWIYNYSVPANQNFSLFETNLNLTMNQTTSSLKLELNGSQFNSNLTAGDSILLNGTLLIGDPSGVLTLFNNNVVINQDTTEVSNITTFPTAGFFSINVTYTDTQNYTFNITTLFVNVSEAPDVEFPIFFNISDNNGSLLDSGIVTIFANINSTNGTAFVQFDNVNFTMFNESGNFFNASFNVATSGTFTYIIGAFGNGTDGNLNITQEFSYTINSSIQPAKVIQLWRNKSSGLNVTTVDNNGNWRMNMITLVGDLIVGGDDFVVDTSNGFVGIGTSTPTHKLNVVGNVNVTGNFIVQGNINITGCIQFNNTGTPVIMGVCI